MARARPTFTDEVKAELANLQPARACCQHAELQAIIGSLSSSADGGHLTVRLTRNAVARTLVHLVKLTGGRVESVAKGPTDRRPSYRLRLELRQSRASDDVCCARAVLRGAFLARGVIGEPGTGYHLELDLPPAQAGIVAAGLERQQVPTRRIDRRGRVVYYLKGADSISRVLGLMGANRAVMRFENDRIMRDLRGQANRRVNSETANLEKRLRAASAQVDRIRRLHPYDPRLSHLPPAVREAALLRLGHPQAGLLELAALAHISKSAMANRLRRLMHQSAENGLID